MSDYADLIARLRVPLRDAYGHSSDGRRDAALKDAP